MSFRRSDEDNKQGVIKESESNFVFVKKLGQGAFATVNAYEYRGQNPVIKQICAKSGGYVAIKQPMKERGGVAIQGDQLEIERKIDANEKEIVSMLQVAATSGRNDSYVQGVRVDIEGTDCLLYEFVAYRKDSAKKLQSADLENFLTDKISDLQYQYQDAGKKSQESLTRMLAEFAITLKKAQDSLHAQGILHLDSALRNYLVDTVGVGADKLVFDIKIADYGMSRPMPEVGSVYLVHPKRMPIHYMDRDALEKRQASIYSDVFALKVSLLEMLALTLGKSSAEVIGFKDHNNEQYFYARREMTNEAALQKCLGNVREMLAEMKVNNPTDARIAIVESFVYSYQAYLTTMPQPGLSSEAARQQDKELFAQATRAHEEQIRATWGESKASPEKLLKSLGLAQKPEKTTEKTSTAAMMQSLSISAADIKSGLNRSASEAAAGSADPYTTPELFNTQPAAKKEKAKPAKSVKVAAAASSAEAASPYTVPEQFDTPAAKKEKAKPANATPAKPTQEDPYSVPDISSPSLRRR